MISKKENLKKTKPIYIESVADYVREVEKLSAGFGLYQDVLDKIIPRKVNKKDYYTQILLLNEFENLVSWSENPEFVPEKEFVGMVKRIGSLVMNNVKVFFSDSEKDRVEKLGYFFEKVTKRKKKKFAYAKTYPLQLFFRGEASTSWNLIPSVFRKEYWGKESTFLHEIQVHSPNEFRGNSHLNTLVTMQHYGCPTRLLDITSNPLNALYFACEMDEKKDGRVIIFPTIKDSVSYFDSDRALILSCLSQMKENEQKLLFKDIESCENHIYKDTKAEKKEYLEKLLLEIKSEKPSFRAQIRLGDILNPLFVQPMMANPRIVNQQGAFILSGLSDSSLAAERKLLTRKANTVICIKAKNKKIILDQLNSIGINKGTIYPNLEKIAEYLKNTLRNKL